MERRGEKVLWTLGKLQRGSGAVKSESDVLVIIAQDSTFLAYKQTNRDVLFEMADD